MSAGLQTFEATFATGWHATVVAASVREARARLRQTGRGERFTVRAGGTHAVWGRDEDDTYEEDAE